MPSKHDLKDDKVGPSGSACLSGRMNKVCGPAVESTAAKFKTHIYDTIRALPRHEQVEAAGWAASSRDVDHAKSAGRMLKLSQEVVPQTLRAVCPTDTSGNVQLDSNMAENVLRGCECAPTQFMLVKDCVMYSTFYLPWMRMCAEAVHQQLWPVVADVKQRLQSYVKRDEHGNLDPYAALPMLRMCLVRCKNNVWGKRGLLPLAELPNAGALDPDWGWMLQLRDEFGITGDLPDAVSTIQQGKAENPNCGGFDDREGSVRKGLREFMHHMVFASREPVLCQRLLPSHFQGLDALPFPKPWLGSAMLDVPPMAGMEFVLLQLALAVEAILPVFDKHYAEYLPGGGVQEYPIASIMLLPCKDTNVESMFSDERRLEQWRPSACRDYIAGAARMKHKWLGRLHHGTACGQADRNRTSAGGALRTPLATIFLSEQVCAPCAACLALPCPLGCNAVGVKSLWQMISRTTMQAECRCGSGQRTSRKPRRQI